MELANQYLMSMKRRELLRQPQLCRNDFSWEEKAFADDTSGVLGGIVWPPRSYSCSFCYREFRSAQALGGHMNVHRRDRARLKQSLVIATTTSAAVSPSDEVQVHHHYQNPNLSSLLQLPIKPTVVDLSSPKDNTIDGNHEPCSGFPFLGCKGSYDLILRKEDSIILNRRGPDDTTLSIGRNNSVVGTRRHGEDGQLNLKRHKSIRASPFPLLVRPCSGDLSRSLRSTTGLKVCNSIQDLDLDLELRLGDAPKVKWGAENR